MRIYLQYPMPNEMIFNVYEPFVKTRQSDDSGAFVFQLNPADIARAIAAKDIFKPLGEFEIVLRPKLEINT